MRDSVPGRSLSEEEWQASSRLRTAKVLPIFPFPQALISHHESAAPEEHTILECSESRALRSHPLEQAMKPLPYLMMLYIKDKD
ncbi:hypothetical protein GCM10011391_33000 [Pullulanibacillus camelliae]|uniref:Uncharacterized protein n=1 Tax=Pullulanibacillus camelliae TaxID=1707096 RepID=A0A8J2YLW5_9BACL|nr:hypothetical protein GCM10011391_33000 [Pullulanibacillus camelliae]